MPSTTWARIALSYALLILLVTGILALLVGNEFERSEEAALRSRLIDQAHAAAYSAAPLFVATAPVTATNSVAQDFSSLFGTRVTFIRPDGVVIGDSEEDPALMENHGQRPEVLQALTRQDAAGSASRLSATVHRRLLYVAVTVQDPASPGRVLGVARVAYPMTSVEQARDALWGTLALTVALVSLPAILLSVVLARSIVGPLSRLRQVAFRFGRGDLTARSHLDGKGEVGVLATEFNTMADRLVDTISQRTQERNQIAAVFEQMHEGILLTDEAGRVNTINRTASALLKMPAEQAVGRSLIEVTHAHELHSALLSAVNAPGERQTVEITTGGQNLAVTVTSVPGANDSTTGLVVLQDVTELRKLERARRDFVANIGHELRTPLASVKLLVETLETAVHVDPDAAQEFLQKINIELDGLTQLVRELLELSKIESGQVQLNTRPTSLQDLLERVVSRLGPQAERGGLTLQVQSSGDLPLAEVDPERIEQLLVNLVHNAIKFTPPGGHATLKAEEQSGALLVSISDTGVGISSEDLPRIFERFYKVDKARTGSPQRDGGTGLGLAIAKHIVQAHGGRIWAESVLDHGTTFYFTLPISLERKQKSENRSQVDC
jgi:two-component system, OmpR family, phosphate regulon sensor histidine kinase PhoR